MTQESGAHTALNSQLVQPPAAGTLSLHYQRLEPPTDTVWDPSNHATR